jgi:antitoxin (DNA-binding transcriptional repressor) of toxin-antitoxin stability system
VKTINMTEFKAKCIKTLKDIHNTGEPVVITLRGTPLALVKPYTEETPARRLWALDSKTHLHDNIVQTDFENEWDMEL